MAINKSKSTKKEIKVVDHEIEVTRAKDMSGDTGVSIAFDMIINGITVYGCFWREGTDKNGKDYEMVAFPSHKGKDGKYYHYAYVMLSDADKENIQKGIESVIDA